MSTIADYSVFTKAFLASGMTDFSKLYGTQFQGEGTTGTLRAFAVIPFNLETPLTPREAMNFDLSKLGLTPASMDLRVSCRDANRNFIGNIVRVQPNKRDGSIRLVAKVAVPGLVSNESDNNPADAPYNTFVLVRTDDSTNVDLPIAVATISRGYNLHKHKVVASVNGSPDQFDVNFVDPLDDVENANYVSFTINNLNGYTSVDFNPDAYATYDDVANALSRSIDGLHIAFDTASGDLKLLDKDGNVLDQANLPIKADVIIADGEEGYKYVKTDVKQDIHAAKAWMPEGSTAWDRVKAVPYTRKHAALVVGQGSSRVFVGLKDEGPFPISTDSVTIAHVEISGSTYMVADIQEGTCNLFKIRGNSETGLYQGCKYSGEGLPINVNGSSCTIKNGLVEGVDVIKDGVTTCVLSGTDSPDRFQAWSLDGGYTRKYIGRIETSGGSSTGGVVGITLDSQSMYTFEEGATTPSEFKNSSGHNVTWFGTKAIPEGYTLKYGLEAFVWTVKGAEDTISDPFFQQLNNSLLALGFHEGDDIALGTNLATLAPTEGVSPLNKVDANDYMHGKNNKATREQEVDTQRANAKEELVAWNAQRPALTENRQDGTIIDSSGLDVRSGSITLGCGRVGAEGEFQKINYGIQMKNRSGDIRIPGRSESLDFMVSHTSSAVSFDANGHAEDLTSSTLLSIEAGSYISGAPTCLILAKVSRKPKDASTQEGSLDPLEGSPVLTPVRTTAGFSVDAPYNASNGLSLTIQDYRDNILRLLNPDLEGQWSVPAIIEVQAIYTHPSAETVPAQQMHTYIGEWTFLSAEGTQMNHPECRFLCNKIEEWMTAIGLADTNPSPDPNPDTNPTENVELYVVIRVY